ncbi:MAG TPA: tRNA lysidine(34) synthetase TilS, partial [Alphaproteobacteria bacterium]|nr:tRNA lysidine(34) synthetase TilS [Alphaproteobacteria bacterium]
MQLNPAPVELAAPEAISAEQFDACMARFAPFPSRAAAIAVSGGPDSMALAYLARGWATKHGIRLMAFIVDHKLRPESSEEAEKVQVRLSQLGIISEVLSWQHEAVVSKLHATARKARYRLLLAACRRHKIGDLLLAHQQDDQAETVLMRFAKGSGVDGLAGIPAENKSNGVRLLRPLLSFSKDNLVATCIEQIIPYVLDPSNRSEKFARGRLRRVMPLLEQEGFTIERLADLASRARDAKDALDHFTSLLLRVAGKQDNAGIVRLSLEQLRSSPRAIALRAVASCLQNIHAEEYAPVQISPA